MAIPSGELIAKPHTTRRILIGDVDAAVIEDTRRNWPSCATAALTATAQSPAG